jgi:hypothetical protein
MEEPMIGKRVGMALASLVGVAALASPALAQNVQFIPHLVYRTGAYAPNGIPVANALPSEALHGGHDPVLIRSPDPWCLETQTIDGNLTDCHPDLVH